MELAYLHELYLFFHNHQYDDKYPTFRESDYEYKNILFYVDGEINMKISKIYNNRFILGRGAPVDPLGGPLKVFEK